MFFSGGGGWGGYGFAALRVTKRKRERNIIEEYINNKKRIFK